MRQKLHPVGDSKRATKKAVSEFRDLMNKPRSSLRGAFGTDPMDTRSPVRLPKQVRGRVPSPRSALRQDLDTFFRSLDPSKPFGRADYQHFVRSVQRSVTGKISDRPAWVDRIREKAEVQLKKNRKEAGRLAVDHIKGQAQAAGGTAKGIKPKALETKAGKMFAGRERRAADKLAKDTLRDLKSLFRRGIGQTNEELIAKLQRLGGRKSPIRSLSTNPAESARAVSDAFFSRAERVARRLGQTELAKAYNEQANLVAGMIQPEPGIRYMKRWDAQLDKKICALCRSMHGDTAPLGQPFRISRLDEPPAHCYCRCVLTLIAVPMTGE